VRYPHSIRVAAAASPAARREPLATTIEANGSLTTPETSHAGRVLRVRGGAPLRGAVAIGGSKNAALPALAATLLTDDECVLNNVPDLADIGTMLDLLRSLGAETEHDRRRKRVSVRAAQITSTDAPAELVARMRASFLVAGPLLARCGEMSASVPGGCRLGTRFHQIGTGESVFHVIHRGTKIIFVSICMSRNC